MPEISKDEPAKTLTEQGAAAHMFKLLDVVKSVDFERFLAAGGYRRPASPQARQPPGGCSTKVPGM